MQPLDGSLGSLYIEGIQDTHRWSIIQRPLYYMDNMAKTTVIHGYYRKLEYVSNSFRYVCTISKQNSYCSCRHMHNCMLENVLHQLQSTTESSSTGPLLKFSSV